MSKSNVELVIRARNEATTALRSISTALQNVIDDQKGLSDQAGQTEGRLGELGRELDALGQNLQALRGVDKLNRDLGRTEQQLRRQRAATQEAQLAYTTLAKSLSDTERPTKRLQNQLAAKQRALDSNREKTTQLERKLHDLTGEYQEARASVTGLAGDESTLATNTAKAAAEFTALQTQIRELRNAAKSRSGSTDLSGVDIPSLTRAGEAVSEVQRRLREVGQQADLTGVDLNELESEIQALEATGKSMGQLKGMVEDFRTLRQQSLEAKRTWQDLEQQTRELAQQFAASAEPSRELAENLGRSRAAARQAKQGYQDARNGVHQYARALQQAGVDTRNLDGSLLAIERGIQRTASVLVQGQVGLDQFRDTQNAQIEASREAAQASEQEAQARKEAARQVYESRRVYRQSKTAVDEARTAYQQAAQQANRLAAAVQQADQPSAGLTGEFERAKRRAGELKQNFLEVRDSYGLLGQAMAEHRQDAGAVAQAQRNLENALDGSARTLQRTGQQMDQAEQALQRYNRAGREAGNTGDRVGREARRAGDGMQHLARDTRRADDSMRAFRDNGRTTLSLMQRIRGQVLSLAGAYVGLFGAFRGVSSIYDVAVQLEATQARLGAVYGDNAERIGEDLEWLRDLADDLGLSFRTMQESYAKFLVASTKAGATTDEGQGVFVALSRVARSQKLPDEQFRGILMAVEQMYSKGRVMAEELRRQLGDRLPGAFKMMADAANVSTAELDEMLQRGEVGSDILGRWAVQLEQAFAGSLPAALSSTQAEMGRFSNAITDLQLQIAQSGFLDELTDGLQAAAEVLATPEAQQGARRLGRALGDLVQQLVDLLDHLDELKLAAQVLGGLFAARFFVQAVAGFRDMARMVGTFTRAMRQGKGAIGAVSRASGILFAAWAAWSIAEWAAEEFPAFGRHWERFKADLMGGTHEIQADFKSMGVVMRADWGGTLDKMGVMLNRFLSMVSGGLASIFELVGDGPVSGALREFESSLDDRLFEMADEEVRAELEAIQKDLENDLEQLDRELGEKVRALGQGPEYTPDVYADTPGRDPRDIPSAADFIDPDQPWFRDISGQLDAIEAELAERSAESLEDRLQLIADEFEDLLAELQRRGDDEAIAKVKELIRLRQEEERARDAADRNGGVDREAERMQAELQRVRRAIKELTADTLEERIALIRDEFAELLNYMERTGNAAGAASVERLIDLRAEQERVKFAQEEQRRIADEQRELEQEVNDLLALRRNLQEQISHYRESSEPGAEDAIGELENRVDGVTVKLRDALQTAMAFAREMGDEKMIANLELMELELIEVREALISADQVNQQFAGSATNALDGFAEAIATGQDAVRSLGTAFRQFAADFLRQIAQMIMQQAILNALQNAGFGAGFAGLFGGGGVSAGGLYSNVATFHTGGIVGTAQGGPARSVPANWFANALRYHEGGIAGLKPNEVPTILERGEEVLTRGDPRHSTNGGKSNQPSVKIINTLDAGEVVSAGLNTPAGERVIMNLMSRNRQKIKSTLG